MAINKYMKDGILHYSVTWCARSPMDRSIKVSRQEDGIAEGIPEEVLSKKLQSIENRIRSDAQREVIRREAAGSKWSTLVDRWEIALKEGSGTLTEIKANTAHTYIQSLKDFTLTWMDRHAADISPADVVEILAKMRNEGYSTCRIYNVKVAINQCFKWGIQKRLVRGIAQSPGVGISINRKNSKRPESLNRTQIIQLLEKAYGAQHPWRQIWRYVLLSGARSGEAYELRVKDIDREEKRIFFERKYNFDSKEIEPLKDAEWRQVPINAELDELLVELGVQAKGPDELVLPRIKAWTNGEAARILRAFCGEAELPSICFHTLRALWATQLLRDGVPQRAVMEMGGWADSETMERYIRRSGIEIEGATDTLCFKPERPARILSLVRSGI